MTGPLFANQVGMKAWPCSMFLVLLLVLPNCRQKPSTTQGHEPSGQSSQSSILPPSYQLSHMDDCLGICDGSGAVAVDHRHFMVVNDETSELLIYHRNQSGPPKQRMDIRKLLDLNKKEEADLEAAARVGDLFYVIGSHSRDNDGNKEKERRRLLAFSLHPEGNLFRIQAEGKVCKDLVQDLIKEEALQSIGLKAAMGHAGDQPEGLNIEALCSGQGDCLWIGFRGPLIDGRALMVQVANPLEIIQGDKPSLGDVRLLDLGGRSIRGAERVGEQILILADDSLRGRGAEAFLWDGDGSDPQPLILAGLNLLDPEAILVFPDTQLQVIQILSDDGGRRRGDRDCMDQTSASAMGFRSATFTY